MTGEITSKPVTALEIYDAYPGSDLIPLNPPLEHETVPAYIKRVGRKNLRECGDTLFAFVFFELSESNEEDARRSCIHMLDVALRDIVSVRNALEKNS
jgi:hypothetical protein